MEYDPAQQPKAQSRVYLGCFFFVVMAFYSLLVLSNHDGGLASLDAYGIISASLNTVETGQIQISRPPGHPLTENYLYPLGIRTLGLQESFSWKHYFWIQFTWGILCLSAFAFLLLRLRVTAWGFGLSLLGLMMGTGFLNASMDGEEFLPGITFVLLGWVMLKIADEAKGWRRLTLVFSAVCFALATAVRLEFSAALVLPAAYFLGGVSPLRQKLLAGLGYLFCWLIFTALLWAPVLLASGLIEPYGLQLTWLDRISITVYKLIFQVYSPALWVAFAYLAFRLYLTLREYLKMRTWPDFVFRSSMLLVVAYHGLFFLYPTKPEFLLVALPGILLLTLRVAGARGLFVVSLLLLIHAFVRPDIFSNREYVGLHWMAGSYPESIAGKPKAKVDYLQRIGSHFENQQSSGLVIVGDVWAWDHDFLNEQMTLDPSGELADWAFVEQQLQGRIQPRTFLNHFPNETPAKADIYVEEALYRELYYRHDPLVELDPIQELNGVKIHLFSLD